MRQIAVLQLSGCAGCKVAFLNAEAWMDWCRFVYSPLVLSAYEVPKVGMLMVSGALPRADQVVAVDTCTIPGGVANDPYFACATHQKDTG